MMKRIVSIALVVLMIAALFAGCSGSSSPEGTYKIKSINGKDVKSYFKESMGALAGEGEEITDEQIDAILALMGINNIDAQVRREQDYVGMIQNLLFYVMTVG